MELKIEQFFIALKKGFFWMLLAFGAAYLFGYFFMRTVYVQPWYSYAEIIINTKEDTEISQIVSREYSLSTTYIQMLTTYRFFNEVSDEIDRIAHDETLNKDPNTGENYFVYDKETNTYPELANLTGDALKGGTKIVNKDKTAILRITYYDYSLQLSPKAVRKVLTTISETVDDYLGNELNVSSIRIVEDARPATRSSTVARDNSLMYGIIAALIVYAVFFIYGILDIRVKRTDDIAKRYNIPLLGTVPYFSSTGGSSSKYSKYNKYSRYSKYSKYSRYSRYSRYSGYAGKYAYASYKAAYRDKKKRDEQNGDKTGDKSVEKSGGDKK